MEINKIHDGVCEIKNFISEEDLSKINNFILSSNQKSWERVTEKNILQIQKKDYPLFKGVEEKIKNLFLGECLVQKFLGVYQYEKNDRHKPHVDNGTDKSIKYGIVIYLNDNFSGGEVFYPSLNIFYKPQKYSLLMHKSDIYHEVLPIKMGNRYILTTFIRNYEDFPVILNSDIMI
jgi:hypothetical protein